MFRFGETVVLILASLWLVEGQPGSMRTADYKVLRNNSGQCYLSCRCFIVFTALHEMQTRSSDENSVCLSVCPSVCLSVTRVIPDKMEERSVQIFIPYERTFSLVL